MAYVYIEYPKAKYHLEPDGSVRMVTVQNRDQEDALGPGWANNPSGPFPEAELESAAPEGDTEPEIAAAPKGRKKAKKE